MFFLPKTWTYHTSQAQGAEGHMLLLIIVMAYININGLCNLAPNSFLVGINLGIWKKSTQYYLHFQKFQLSL